MGWKYTEIISRDEAQRLIRNRMFTASNEELENALESLGYGDTTGIEYYGANFRVTGDLEDQDRELYERLKEKFE
jgi:hypothetical protein